MASISFLAGENYTINDLAGSGLGFYGPSFGSAVETGHWQDRTFITNAAGTAQGPEADNVKYVNPGSGVIGSAGSGQALTTIPNDRATLNVRFTHPTPVQVQNAEFRIYDRSDTDRPASGVTTKVAELIHPDPVQSNNGSGDTTWITPGGSGTVVSLAPSPGPSGLYAGNGSDSTYAATQHDWYLAISASPDSVGSKTLYGGYFSCEYL